MASLLSGEIDQTTQIIIDYLCQNNNLPDFIKEFKTICENKIISKEEMILKIAHVKKSLNQIPNNWLYYQICQSLLYQSGFMYKDLIDQLM